METVYSLLYKSIDKISTNLINDKIDAIYLEFDNSTQYFILKPTIINYFQQNDISLYNTNIDSLPVLDYFIEEINVDYTNTFRDGIFGEYLTERKIDLKGSYFLNKNVKVGEVNKFEYSNIDTILYNEISSLENIAYNFTTAKVPDEPFFSSLLEPAIVIGASAIVIYLFFTVRSN